MNISKSRQKGHSYHAKRRWSPPNKYAGEFSFVSATTASACALHDLWSLLPFTRVYVGAVTWTKRLKAQMQSNDVKWNKWVCLKLRYPDVPRVPQNLMVDQVDHHWSPIATHFLGASEIALPRGWNSVRCCAPSKMMTWLLGPSSSFTKSPAHVFPELMKWKAYTWERERDIYIYTLQYVFPLFVCKCHSWCCCCLRLTLAYLGYQATLGTEKVTLRCFHFHWQQHFPHNTAASDKSGYMLLRVTPVTSTTITTSSKFSHATFNTHLGTKKRYALNSFNTKATTTWTRRTSLALSHRHASSLRQAHAQIPALFSTEMTHTLTAFVLWYLSRRVLQRIDAISGQEAAT